MTFPDHVKFFIVGGYVRDRLLGRECNDHDFVVVGATPEMMIENGFQQVGADFPVFLNECGDEYALARKERKVAAGYHGFETDFDPSVTLEDDLRRRDLTINAMAREVLDWNEFGHAKLNDEIIDPFNGQEDLKNGIVRHVSEAFAEDPVRVLRAARFAARYNFRIAGETLDLMRWLVRDGELNHLTAERVWLEIEKTMKDGNDTFGFFKLLEAVDALDIILPGIDTIHPALHKADVVCAPVSVKCALLTADMNQQLVGEFWRKVKAPNDVVSVATAAAMVVCTLRHTTECTPEQIVSILKALNAYQEGDNVTEVLSAVSLFDSVAFNDDVMSISTGQYITKNISFSSLSEEQQATLKGKEIGEAIDALRAEKVKQYLETKAFLFGK